MKRHIPAVGAALARGLGTLAVIGAASLVARPAAAQEFEIKSPFVDEGEFEVEEHGNFQFRYPNQEQDEEADDEDSGGDKEENVRQFHELSIGYGVTDWWEPQLQLSLQQLKHSDTRVETIGVENTFQLLPTNAHFFNLGLDLGYEFAVHDEIQSLEFGPLIQVWTGPFSNTINLLFEQDFGSDRESGATGLRVRLADALQGHPRREGRLRGVRRDRAVRHRCAQSFPIRSTGSDRWPTTRSTSTRSSSASAGASCSA